jgi:anhydro-N-acetylmuramic acid kinase
VINKIYSIVGVMSGTSLDGVDLCWVKFSKKENWSFDILAAETHNYTPSIKSRLQSAIALSSEALIKLDRDYTMHLAECLKLFIKKYKIKNLDAVCSHGHTIFHQPDKGITFQIGNLPILADAIKQTVVCDFRVQDVAMGGQGAPLVPIGDLLLFPHYDFCLNLGGFANISFQNNSQRIAFDICPANITLNHYAQLLGCPFDNNGEFAKKGALNSPLLEALNNLEFYKKQPPKSLGLEWVQNEIYDLVDAFDLSPHSILRTLVEHSAIQIVNILKKQDLKSGLYTGGGVLNSFLMHRISKHYAHQISDQNLDLVHYKEALVFAFLGVLKLRGEVNCLRSVTGAKQDHSSGKIYFYTSN